MRLLRYPAFMLAALAMSSVSASADDHETDNASGQTSAFSAEYSGSVYILKVADISLSARLEPETYSSAATFQSGGLLRWFDDTDIVASVTGYRRDEGLAPYRYEHVNRSSNKGRVVGIDFPEGTAVPDVNPPFGSMGDPAATDEERLGAMDPISVILSLVLSPPGAGESVCDRTLPIFDGKARYDLRFISLGQDDVRTRAYRGDALRCHAFIEPISGYDEGDRPTQEEIARPVNIWFVEMDGIHVPVRFRAATQIGNISIEARRIRLGEGAF